MNAAAGGEATGEGMVRYARGPRKGRPRKDNEEIENLAVMRPVCWKWRLAMTAALEDVPWTRFSLEIQSRLLRFWSISFFFFFSFTFWNNATCKFEVILICVLLAVCVSLFFFCGCIEINGMRNYVVLYMRYCKFLRDGSFWNWAGWLGEIGFWEDQQNLN